MTYPLIFKIAISFCVFTILLISCNGKDSEKDIKPEHNKVHTKPIADPNPYKSFDDIESKKFKTPSFSVEVPKDFEAISSIPSNTSEEGFDSYFFVSPDASVQFYLYASKTIGTPYDIIFPNEKIAVKSWQNGDTLQRTWELTESNQIPYQRSFHELKTEKVIVITGFYYKNKSAHDNYIEQFSHFKKSVRNVEPTTHH